MTLKQLVWHYDKANRGLILRALSVFPWEKLLNPILNPNNQVKLLNETILNIMKNFVPSSSITSNWNEPEWITRDVKKQKKSLQKLSFEWFYKHLDLTLDAKLTFASHIDEKLKKARQGLGLIRTLSRYLSVKTLEQI